MQSAWPNNDQVRVSVNQTFSVKQTFSVNQRRCPKAAASAASEQLTYATIIHRITSFLGKTSRAIGSQWSQY